VLPPQPSASCATTDAEVIEVSLAENVEREPMDVIDEFVAISDLVKKGQDPETIAAHFGLTLQIVKRCLALGRLIPAIHKLFRDEQVGEKELQLLTFASKDKQKEYADLANNPKGKAP
jgi:ParB family chromosome partitioning protein